MLQISTGFMARILGPESFEDIFNGGAIKVFDGFRPTTADGVEPPSPVGLITINGGFWSPPDIGNGLRFVRSTRYALKVPADVWHFLAARTGVPQWGRLVTPLGDAGGVSYEAARIDFSISSNPDDHAELTLPVSFVTAGQTVPIDGFTYTFPPLPSSP